MVGVSICSPDGKIDHDPPHTFNIKNTKASCEGIINSLRKFTFEVNKNFNFSNRTSEFSYFAYILLKFI